MARADVAGFFWDDTPPPKPPKVEKPKRTPPTPVWLSPTYLPGIEEARAMRLNLFTDAELVEAASRRERLVWDIECYPNYFLVAFKSVDSGKIVYFELSENSTIDLAKLNWVVHAFTLIDYNGNKYDVPIVSIALTGRTTETLFAATDLIINGGRDVRPHHVLKKFKTTRVRPDHIDLIELVALRPSLKLLAGRLHAKRMQDLPFVPGTVLTPDQRLITLWYCINDLNNTELLYKELLPDIRLRERMGIRYGGIDLRSHSDAQMAETIIASEIKKLTGQKHLQKPVIAPGTVYRYQIPKFIRYETPLMNWVLGVVQNAWFALKPSGKLIMPPEIKALKIQIGDAVYKMGIGGLHSTEKRAAHVADETTNLCDRDVNSYYPRIILNCLLAPLHLGAPFLRVYNGIVVERLQCKDEAAAIKEAYKATGIPHQILGHYEEVKTGADGLKIVVNGSFGKLGSMYSVLFAPDLMIQVTITGQLAILMLIERLVLRGIPVVSANTDGIVIKCPKARQAEADAIVAQWERETGFETEATFYKALYSRDVNNYFAVKQDDTCKVKGVYAEKGSSRNSILSKNPMNQICSDAVEAMLTKGTPVAETIRGCRDIRKFVTVRTVKGGAVKVYDSSSTLYLGKAVRWYYALNETGEIVYARSGNKVPRTEAAKPLMELPDEFPADVDYAWYEIEATKILIHVGFMQPVEGIDLNDEEDEDEETENEEDEMLV